MSLKTLFTCGICSNIFIDPIILPCSNTICKSHLINEQKYNCHFCKIEHSIPIDGFKENLMAKHIIDNGHHLTPDEKRIQNKMQESCSKLEELLSSYEIKFNQTETKLFDHFSDIKTKIDLKREELKLEIDNYADSLVEKVKDIEKNLNLFFDDIKSNDDQLKNNFLELKQSFKVEFSRLNIDTKILEQYVADLDKNINEVNEKFNSIESIQHENLTLQFNSSNEKVDMSCLYGNILFLSDQATIQKFSNNNKPVKKTFADKCVDCNLLYEDEEDDYYDDDDDNESDDGSDYDDDEESDDYNDDDDDDDEDEDVEDLFKENILISCSDDQTIQIWDLENECCVKSIKEKGPIIHGFAYMARSITMYGSGDRLITISNKRVLKIWNSKNYNLLKTFKARVDIAACLVLSEEKFVIAIGKNVFVWSLKLNSYHLIKHRSTISCLEKLSENYLITGTNDNKIKVWNIENSECIKSFDHSTKINSLLVLNQSD